MNSGLVIKRTPGCSRSSRWIDYNLSIYAYKIDDSTPLTNLCGVSRKDISKQEVKKELINYFKDKDIICELNVKRSCKNTLHVKHKQTYYRLEVFLSAALTYNITTNSFNTKIERGRKLKVTKHLINTVIKGDN